MNHVSKKFGKIAAVDQVTLTVQKGSIYGLIGSNGAGKTTLLKLLAGIYLQDNGEITIDNASVFENVYLKEKVFYIPDQPYFLYQYNTTQMAQFYKSVYPTWSDERFRKLCEQFEVDFTKKIHTFSKGWQRQIAFILAFSSRPDFLILDEPLDGLDPVVRKRIKNLLIQEVADREMTILISSHNLREVEDLCDFVGILHQGKLVMEKELDVLKSDIHKIQLAYTGGIPEQVVQKLNPLHTEKRGSILLCIIRGQEEEIVNELRKTNPVILDLLPLTLEEIFIYEMGDIGYAINNFTIE